MSEESIYTGILLVQPLSARLFNDGVLEYLTLPLKLLAGCRWVTISLVQSLITTIQVIECLGLERLIVSQPCGLIISLGSRLYGYVLPLLVAKDIRVLI